MFLASPFVYKKVSSCDALCQTQCFCKMRYFLSSLLECFVLWSELISCFSMQFSPFLFSFYFWGSFYAFKGITSFLFYTHNMVDSKASHIRKKERGNSLSYIDVNVVVLVTTKFPILDALYIFPSTSAFHDVTPTFLGSRTAGK